REAARAREDPVPEPARGRARERLELYDRGRRLRLSQTGFDRRAEDVGKDLAHRLANGRRNGLREQFDRPRVDIVAMALAVEYGEALADALEQPREPTAPSVHHLGDDADQGSGAHEEHER